MASRMIADVTETGGHGISWGAHAPSRVVSGALAGNGLTHLDIIRSIVCHKEEVNDVGLFLDMIEPRNSSLMPGRSERAHFGTREGAYTPLDA
jgi:hypothetical protein